MELRFELNTALTVKSCALEFVEDSIVLENSQLAIANTLVLLIIISVLFGQLPTPKK
jgi:hypothetical protein